MKTVSDNKMHEQQGSLSGHTHMSFLHVIINGTAVFTILCCFMIRVRNVFLKNGQHTDLLKTSETSFLIMKRVRNVFPNYDYRGQNVFLIRGRNVFPKYEEGAKRLS